MSWFEAIILGLIQGLTEFLPVSSSGHLEIASALFGINPEQSFTFTVAVHGATVLSTLVVFRQEIVKLVSGSLKLRYNEESEFVLKIILSMVPVAITGLFFKDKVEALFSGSIVFIGIMLLITSALLFAGHFFRNRNRKIGYLDALIIGIAQAVAVIPGISRSGATISTGLMLGNSRDEIARFSFLMVIVPVLGANLLELTDAPAAAGNTSLALVATGFITAFISGYMACRWMISLVKRSKMIWFAIYCLAAGTLSIIFG